MWKVILALLPIPVQVLIALGMYRRKQHTKYPAFWSYLWFESARLTLLGFLAPFPTGPAFFAVYWGSQFLTTVFTLAVLREVFLKLLADYSALTSFQRRGYEVGLAIACFAAIVASTLIPGHTFFVREMVQVQQTVSSVAVAMLIFVGAASLVLGIRWRSELCGIAAGLGLQGIADVLVFTGTLHRGSYNPSLIGWIETIAYDFSVVVFALYFLVPQEESAAPPVRRELVEWVESMSERLPR
jgi:hypothetical protein